MKVKELKELKYLKLEKENCLISYLDSTKNYGSIIARILPKETLTLHRHTRPRNGDEVFIFHKGGSFQIETDKIQKKFRVSYPVLLRFSSKEPHSVTNLSETVLEFLGIYVPPFEEGEVQILFKSKGNK